MESIVSLNDTKIITGKSKRVYVTMDKNTPQTRKNAQRALDKKIEKVQCKPNEQMITLKELVDAYREDQKVSVKEATYTRNYHACNALMRRAKSCLF